MITLFAIPKPMEGEFLRLQENAIDSWIRLGPEVEVILFGNEAGVADFARRRGVAHFEGVARNEYGTPRVDDLFRRAEAGASEPLLGYVNADIILGRDLIPAIRILARERRTFLAVGRRWDLDLEEAVVFSDPHWEDRLRKLARERGNMHASSGIDYFIYRRGLWKEIPPFAVGRTMWDNWLIWRARAGGAMVVDATPSIWALHQNHGYNHHPEGWKGVWKGPEAEINGRLAGGLLRYFTIDDATHELADGKLRRFLDGAHLRRGWITLPALWAPARWAQGAWKASSAALYRLRVKLAKFRGRIPK
jgi:hypothetical protein